MGVLGYGERPYGVPHRIGALIKEILCLIAILLTAAEDDAAGSVLHTTEGHGRDEAALSFCPCRDLSTLREVDRLGIALRTATTDGVPESFPGSTRDDEVPVRISRDRGNYGAIDLSLSLLDG